MGKVKREGTVKGRLVEHWSVEGVGTVRVGYDAGWEEYRVQSWYPDGTLQGDYPTSDKEDAMGTARLVLEAMAGPNEAQREAVLHFADRHGRGWKEELSRAWYTGRDASEPFGYLLRQVRNRFGPAWLERVTLSDLRAMQAGCAQGADSED